jgi:hypothetical protein
MLSEKAEIDRANGIAEKNAATRRSAGEKAPKAEA